MALAIFTYRPVFSTFLQDTNIKELIKTNLVVTERVIKSDTIKIEFGFVEHTINKMNVNGIFFTREKSDTIAFIGTLYPPLSALGETDINKLKKEIIEDIKPKYSNIILPSSIYWKFISLVFLLILYVTMVYGPIAAFLVEMFPTRIRYTSMSLPYHIGNGVFGGLVPFIGLLLTSTYTTDPLVGLWYPIGVAGFCLVVGIIYLRNKIDRNIKD